MTDVAMPAPEAKSGDTDLARAFDSFQRTFETFRQETDGRIGEIESVPHVIRLLDDPASDVREAAHRSLVQLTGLDIGTDRAAWEGWWDAQSPDER